jgi:ferrous iron transport protein B
VLRRVWEAVREFIVRAGTLILAASLVIWALMYFPHDASIGERRDAAVAAADASVEVARAEGVKGPALDGVLAGAEEAKAVAEREAQGAWSRGSWLGQAGHVIEPVFAPIGWDWKVSVAVLASFPAREVVVSTLGVIYDVEAEDESSEALRDQLRQATWESGAHAGEPVFDLGSALALMVFFALCCQCVSTLVVMRRETGSWGWPVLAFTYMTVLAWVGAFLTSAIF